MKVFFVRHGQTQANVEKRPYKDIKEPLTEKGILQAKKAGEYLKQFGKFDLVISSPATRSIMTAENIMKEIDYNKKIKVDDLILEDITPNYAGLSHDEIKIIEKNNIELQKIITYYYKITDPFERLEYYKKIIDTVIKLSMGGESETKQFNKHKKFLSKLKKLNKKCVLVVGHGGTINYMTRIITNTYFDLVNPIDIIDRKTREKCISYKNDVNNTSIMGCLIKNNKTTLVIAPHTKHLDSLL
jgi:broad specificity phosphatase PhoE